VFTTLTFVERELLGLLHAVCREGNDLFVGGKRHGVNTLNGRWAKMVLPVRTIIGNRK